MATNVYFNNYGASQEQLLIENLIIESIKIYGVDVYYIPRTMYGRDDIYREGEYYTFESAIAVEMYVKNVEGMEGSGEFLSKFGIQVSDQMTFTMAQRVWTEEVGDYLLAQRPREGDLIYFPFTDSVFQIKYVNVRPIFYQLGALQTYDITCDLFSYNNEVFSTGIPAIDNAYNKLSIANLGNTSIGSVDSTAQNDEFEENDDFIDFTEIDPFSEGRRY